MNATATITALMAAQTLPDTPDGAEVPEWVHLVPSGDVFTHDGRGPYRVSDAQAVIEHSMSQRGDIEIDVNHASIKAAAIGGEAPARGWIVEMQAREDGIWGRVDWTDEGRQLVASKAYRRISPVFQLARKGSHEVIGIVNASLVNRQNLRGLVALNSEEQHMSFLERLAKALGLEEGADEAAVLAKVNKMGGGGDTEAAQSQISEIGVALGLEAGADGEAVLNAAQAAGSDDGNEIIVALQSDLRTATAQIAELQTDRKRDAAESVVDGAIAELRAGVNATSRDKFVSMHMSDPEGTEAIINGMPKLNQTGTTLEPPETAAAKSDLSADEIALQAQEYQGKIEGNGGYISFPAAVDAIMEGKT